MKLFVGSAFTLWLMAAGSPAALDSGTAPSPCDLRVVVEIAADSVLGQLRVAPVALGAGGPKALLAVYSQDAEDDPYVEMFFYPKDTLKLMVFTASGQVLWRRDLGRGVVPGVWFCPVFPFDLDGDGVDEIWLVNNPDADHPLGLAHRQLERLDARTGKTLGHWPWPETASEQSPSHLYRNFIFGGFAKGKPVLVTAQGTYGPMQLQGWNPDLSQRWERRIAKDAPGARGSHMTPIVDLDGDDVDEVLWGERCIELASGTEQFCADRDSYSGHSDVVQPAWDPLGKRWLIYTCREGAGDVAPRVAAFDSQGRRLWGDLAKGHIDMGWVARSETDGAKIALAIRIGGKTAGPRGFARQAVEEFAYDLSTGQRRSLPFRAYETLPVDVNGDGAHEFVRGLGKGDGSVLNFEGRVVGKIKGAVVLASKVLDLAGEQIVTFTPEGKILIWADANGRDTDAARWRYSHRFYRANQRLTANGYNLVNLGGL